MLPNFHRRYAQDPLGWNNSETSRLGLAILLAPFAPTPLIIVALLFSGKAGFSFGLFGIMLLAGMFGVLAALVLGGPIYYLYRIVGWNSWWSYCLGGALAAVTATFVILHKGPVTVDAFFNDIWKFVALFAPYGGIAGLAFWAIVRPDRLGT